VVDPAVGAAVGVEMGPKTWGIPAAANAAGEPCAAGAFRDQFHSPSPFWITLTLLLSAMTAIKQHKDRKIKILGDELQAGKGFELDKMAT
jgi:hypothetical protein